MNKLHYTLALLVACITLQSTAYADNTDGIIRLASPYTATATIDRLENILLEKGMTVFKRVSHTDGANKVGLKLRPTELLIFGNPKVGTPLMQCQQSAAIDLPQKALAYEDPNGRVWLAYNDPKYMQKRHNIRGCDKAVKKVENALSNFMHQAVQN